MTCMLIKCSQSPKFGVRTTSVVLTTVVRTDAMFDPNRPVTCFIAALACLSFVCGEKMRVCVVDGKGGFKVSAHYCPVLDQPDSNVQCVMGVDRLDCLRRLSKGTADFTILTPEDLVTAHTSEIEVLLTNELRYTDDKYEYEVVAVVDKSSGIRSRHDLKEKKYCHPGYGYETDWSRIIANFFEASVVPQMCNPKLTINENRVRASSQFFKSACKAGPWVNDFHADEELKRKYPNLCALCDSPRCTMNDKYWGRRGPLFCLTDGAGQITWSRWDDVQIHFGLTPGSTEASPDNYSLLCPDDTMIPLNTTNPCVWVVKPWPVVATKRSSAQTVQNIVSNLTTDDAKQYALLNLISASSLIVEKLQPIEPIETYLSKATGFLSANSFSGCHPPRTIKICTTSIAENAKCAWLRETAAVYGIEPDLDCIKADNTTHCMMAMNTDNAADVVMVPPDLTTLARREYNLKPLFYETVLDNEKYITIAVIRHNAPMKKLEDLRGKKACFPVHDGVAWTTVKHLLHASDLLDCPLEKGMMNFFGPSCVPGINKNSSLTEICKGHYEDGERAAFECLAGGEGEVAFLSKNSFQKFIKDNTHGYKLEDFTMICEDPMEPCHLSWSPVGYGMIRTNSSEMWMRDTVNVFLQLDMMFGRSYKSLTTPFTMYGKYDNKSNLLFKDVTQRLRDVPVAKNIDSMPFEYESVLSMDKPCVVSSQPAILSPTSLFLFINIVILLVFTH